MAKIASDQAKPNGVLWVIPGQEAEFLAPLDVRKMPGVGKVAEEQLHTLGIRKVGDLRRLDEAFLERRFGKWGLALAGKSRGLDAGGWFDHEVGAPEGPKSISHEHTFSEDTADRARLEATLARLCEMVGRRLREHGLAARTIQLKLRYSDFSTITRAHSVERATQLDTELFEEIRQLFRRQLEPDRRAPAGRARVLLGPRRGADGPARRSPPRTLAAHPAGRRPPARPLRRIGRGPGRRTARGLPRTGPREPRRVARQRSQASVTLRSPITRWRLGAAAEGAAGICCSIWTALACWSGVRIW